MRELRPHFGDEAEFVRWVDELQRPEGYRVVAVFEDGAEEAAAVAGFRVGHMLSRGRHLYVDDLSTLPSARRRGYGRALLDWLDGEARRHECDRLHLDSGVEANRQDAHRLYFNTGLRISAYHFSRALEEG
jgi:GNAT superfamily N-acetyltransferase